MDKGFKSAEKTFQDRLTNVKPTFMKVHVEVDAPMFILPIKLGDDVSHNYDPDPSTECCLINMGHFTINTDPKVLDSRIKYANKPYDIYNMRLKQIYMKYYRSIQIMEKDYHDQLQALG